MKGRKKTITITGGSGYVGGILRSGLRRQGYNIEIFDTMKGFLVDTLRRRYLGSSPLRLSRFLAPKIRHTLTRAERLLVNTGVIRPASDNILDPPARLVERFRNSYAVIHLAAIPHPHVPGMTAADFRRINYEGSVNVFEAARAAGVEKFLFSSSAQVYNINNPTYIEQFPVLETNYLPTIEEGQNSYGFYKGEFERYLSQRCTGEGIEAVAFRLEYPGIRSVYPWNYYISTSVENTVSGFVQGLETDISTGFDVFNLADQYVDEKIVDMQEFLKTHWPGIPNYTTGNECILSTEKARRVLGYEPKPGGTYYSGSVIW